MDADFRAPGLSGIALPPRAWLGAARHRGTGPRRARDFAAGRLAAARSLAAWGRNGPVPRGPDGAPCWPAGVVGAITHRDGLALALTGARAGHGGLGLDLETLIDRPDEIALAVLTHHERARFAVEPLTTTVIFSAKESLFKALYPVAGLRFGFDAAAVTTLGSGVGSIHLTRAIGTCPAGTGFGFVWSRVGGQVVTAVSLDKPGIAPPSTYGSVMATWPA